MLQRLRIRHLGEQLNGVTLGHALTTQSANISPLMHIKLDWSLFQSGLMLAAMDGHMLLLRELIHLQGIDLNICDNEGNTALHLAAQAGHFQVTGVWLIEINF